MNEHEAKFIAAFVLKEKRDRYGFLLGSPDPKRRGQCLARLNHCSDLDERCVTWLPSNADVVRLLRQEGSPKEVYLLSCSSGLDGRTMPLKEAVEAVPLTPENGWGTIISCIPGELAHYYDEEGVRRAILRRRRGRD